MERYRVHQPAGVAVELLRIFSVGLIFVLTDHIFFFCFGGVCKKQSFQDFQRYCVLPHFCASLRHDAWYFPPTFLHLVSRHCIGIEPYKRSNLAW